MPRIYEENVRRYIDNIQPLSDDQELMLAVFDSNYFSDDMIEMLKQNSVQYNGGTLNDKINFEKWLFSTVDCQLNVFKLDDKSLHTLFKELSTRWIYAMEQVPELDNRIYTILVPALFSTIFITDAMLSNDSKEATSFSATAKITYSEVLKRLYGVSFADILNAIIGKWNINSKIREITKQFIKLSGDGDTITIAANIYTLFMFVFNLPKFSHTGLDNFFPIDQTLISLASDDFYKAIDEFNIEHQD